jgi:hypothetical protein
MNPNGETVIMPKGTTGPPRQTARAFNSRVVLAEMGFSQRRVSSEIQVQIVRMGSRNAFCRAK